MRLMMVALFVVSTAVLGCEEEPPCVDANDCAGGEVCVAGDCLTAFGQEYLLSSASAEDIPQSHPDGSGLWDNPPTMPDPYLTFEEAGGWTCTTFHQNNTLTPQWTDLTCPSLVIDETSSFSWTVEDDDEREPPELIAALPAGEELLIQVEWLHDGSFTSTADDVTVRIHFTPVQPEE